MGNNWRSDLDLSILSQSHLCLKSLLGSQNIKIPLFNNFPFKNSVRSKIVSDQTLLQTKRTVGQQQNYLF